MNPDAVRIMKPDSIGAKIKGIRFQSCLLAMNLCTLLAATGCQHTPRVAREAIMDYRSGSFAQAEAALRPTIEKKNEDYVLNLCRFGSCALAAGDLAGAEHAFFEAYQVINSANTNDPGRTLEA